MPPPVKRASTGPTIARMNTYGVATAPTCARDVPTKPMMTSENSPRAMSAVPARNWPGRATPSRRAANCPVNTFVAAVTAASASAAGSIGTRVGGVHGKPDGEEEDRREQIAQRAQHGAGAVGRLAGQGEPD